VYTCDEKCVMSSAVYAVVLHCIPYSVCAMLLCCTAYLTAYLTACVRVS
jgi:hypothetical protein